MADNNLQVRVGADVSGLNRGLKTAEKSVNKFGVEATRASKGMDKLGAGTRGAVPAMTSFSQVIQDAPFGIRGVANNITQLTAQMGHLSKNAGGTKNALKAMLGTLAGPAGILLIVSAVTSLMVSFDGSLSDLIGTTTNLKKAFKAASEEIGKQIGKLTQLKDAYINTNTSTEDRIRILDKLKKDYPSYFSALSTEETSVNDITKAYNLQKKALIGLGITKALEAQKAPFYAQLAEQAIKQAKLDARTFTDAVGVAFGTGAGLSAQKQTEISAELQRAQIQRQIDLAKAEINVGLKEITDTVDAVVADYDLGLGDILGLTDDKGKSVKDLRDKVTALEAPLVDSVKILGKKGKAAWDEIMKFYGEGGVKLSFVPTPDELTEDEKRISAHLLYLKLESEKAAIALDQFNNEASQILHGGITDTFSQLGTLIGDTFANGTNVLAGAGAAMLGVFADILMKYGALVVSFGIAKEGLSKSLKNPFGGGAGAIVAGTLLIAAGAAIKAFSGKMASGSAGGSSTVGGSGSAPSVTSNAVSSTTSSNLQNVIFEIQGTKLVGVFNNTIARNNSLGGNLVIG